MFAFPAVAVSLILADLSELPQVGLTCPAPRVPEIRLPDERPKNVRPWKPRPPDVPPDRMTTVTTRESKK